MVQGKEVTIDATPLTLTIQKHSSTIEEEDGMHGYTLDETATIEENEPKFLQDCYATNKEVLSTKDWTDKAEDQLLGLLFGMEKKREAPVASLNQEFNPVDLIDPAQDIIQGWRRTWTWTKDGKEFTIALGKGPLVEPEGEGD
ncbi:UNVERIFIED_CONTAM: hypothetical protein ORL81_27490, partial [Bacillus cereus]